MIIMRTMLPSNLHSTYPAHQSGVVGKAPPATSSDISRVDSAFACVTSPPREPHTTRSRDDCQRTAYTDFHSSRRSTFWRVLGPPSNHVGTRRTAYDSPPVKWHFGFYRQSSLDLTSSKCMPQLQKCTWYRCNLDLWPLTLKTFSAMPTHIMNICVKFHWNPYRDIVSRQIVLGVNERTDGWMDHRQTSCLRRLLLASKA